MLVSIQKRRQPVWIDEDLAGEEPYDEKFPHEELFYDTFGEYTSSPPSDVDLTLLEGENLLLTDGRRGIKQENSCGNDPPYRGAPKKWGWLFFSMVMHGAVVVVFLAFWTLLLSIGGARKDLDMQEGRGRGDIIMQPSDLGRIFQPREGQSPPRGFQTVYF